MKYLPGTHTLLWIIQDHSNVSEKVKTIYLNQDNPIFVSLVSIWEIVINFSTNIL